jgi:hypothetical protein
MLHSIIRNEPFKVTDGNGFVYGPTPAAPFTWMRAYSAAYCGQRIFLTNKVVCVNKPSGGDEA